MTCKCGARAYEDHLAKVRAGYPGHTYRGIVWHVKAELKGMIK